MFSDLEPAAMIDQSRERNNGHFYLFLFIFTVDQFETCQGVVSYSLWKEQEALVSCQMKSCT